VDHAKEGRLDLEQDLGWRWSGMMLNVAILGSWGGGQSDRQFTGSETRSNGVFGHGLGTLELLPYLGMLELGMR